MKPTKKQPVRLRNIAVLLAIAAVLVALVQGKFGIPRFFTFTPGTPASQAKPDDSLKAICDTNNIAYPLKRPRFVVHKAEREIELYDGNTLLKTYPIALGLNPKGRKEKSGDGKTPEGTYYMIKHSSPGFGKCFYISYPDIEDARAGREAGLITRGQLDEITAAIHNKSYPPANTKLGGQILLHGTKDRSESDLTARDWTLGCIAMENAHILELLDAIPSAARPPISILASKPEQPRQQ